MFLATSHPDADVGYMSVECFANSMTVNYEHISHKAESKAVSRMSNAARSTH